MKNQFTDTYKKLPTSKLLEIIENRKDYQAEAVETAKLELASRQDIETAKSELKEKNIEVQKKLADVKQKRKEISGKAFKVLEYADPLVEKTPEKTIVIICAVLLLIFLFKTVTSFGMVVSAFKEIADGDFSVYWFLIEYIYLPVAIFFLWRKTRTGWTMFLVWLIYQSILDCFGLYMCYQFSDIPDSFPTFMPMPNLSQYLFQLVFHGGLIYFICKPTTKALFPNTVDEEPLTDEAET
jgi:hypothetical protein